ncbi:MAG: hypothetical protein JWM56_159 [Candidatus Peribacteria bacterium]|nr:hypothetical protein [Candidatus Peribacteria bacterium]
MDGPWSMEVRGIWNAILADYLVYAFGNRSITVITGTERWCMNDLLPNVRIIRIDTRIYSMLMGKGKCAVSALHGLSAQLAEQISASEDFELGILRLTNVDPENVTAIKHVYLLPILGVEPVPSFREELCIRSADGDWLNWWNAPGATEERVYKFQEVVEKAGWQFVYNGKLKSAEEITNNINRL